jgi:hypothetical protein
MLQVKIQIVIETKFDLISRFSNSFNLLIIVATPLVVTNAEI